MENGPGKISISNPATARRDVRPEGDRGRNRLVNNGERAALSPPQTGQSLPSMRPRDSIAWADYVSVLR